MRIVTYGAACSLDGFIAGSGGEIDWLHHSKDVNAIMREYWKSVDTILMGRKTWDFAVSQGGGGGGGGSSAIRTYVFSRTLTSIDTRGAELVRDDAGAFVRELKQRRGKGICLMGGGDFARSLFEANVVDEVGMNVHPVLLGAGVPMFLDPCHRVALELVRSRTIEGGCVYSMYRVTH
ncbi:MAG TPA: dihydrofolate reductase family protein [Gemmatimonadaceae bacterium]|jgi:dihydrofolate reductase